MSNKPDGYMVVWDDECGLVVPMAWDLTCEGAITAFSDPKKETVALFPGNREARTAISISTALARLEKAQGKPYNEDFLEAKRHLRILPVRRPNV